MNLREKRGASHDAEEVENARVKSRGLRVYDDTDRIKRR